MKKKKQSKRDRLTVKQSKLLQALPTSDSVAEAGERAGDHDRQTARRALKSIAERVARSSRKSRSDDRIRCRQMPTPAP